MHQFIEDSFANTRLEYPDFEPSDELIAWLELAIVGEITFDEVVELVIASFHLSPLTQT